VNPEGSRGRGQAPRGAEWSEQGTKKDCHLEKEIEEGTSEKDGEGK
jgi:hypothetical protein